MTALPETAAPLDAQPRPRNKVSWAHGQRNRQLITSIMLDRARRFPLARPYTAEALRDLLRLRGVYLAISTTRWHIERIRDAADIEANGPSVSE